MFTHTENPAVIGIAVVVLIIAAIYAMYADSRNDE